MVGYTEKILGGTAIIPHVAADLDSLASTGVHTTSWGVFRQCFVKRVGVLITTATVSSADIVVKFKQYVTYGSSSGEVVVATVNIPTAKAASTVIYKDITPVGLVPGQQLIVEVTTAAAGGGAAGNCLYLCELDDDPEYVTNESNMVASS